jgi:DNA primase
MQSPAEQIKERLPIHDVVASYIRLEKAGIYFKARCPFHNEKSASFFVSPSRNSYHCFGCGRGGDIFSFVQEIEGIDFVAALKLLAERAGITLTKTYTKEDGERVRLHDAMEDATSFYEGLLANNPHAKKYLQTRGLTEKTIKEFRIGFSPSSWSALYEHLKTKNYSDEELVKAGLVIRGKRDYFDRFRDRIMFPIMDSRGKVVAFTGRIFANPGVAVPADSAKYVNSPETALYSKSHILYGYHLAKQAILKENAVIMVEGQMDLIMAQQAGTKHSVAVSGTALTKEHLALIKRFTNNVIFCFDGDSAGIEAGGRSVKLALAEGMEVSLLSLPQGQDPADYILEHGTDAWEKLAGAGKHVIDFYLDILFRTDMDAEKRMLAIQKQILPYVALLQSRIVQGHYISKIADLAHIAPKYIDEEVSKLQKPAVPEAVDVETPIAIKSNAERLYEQLLGYYLLGHLRNDSRIARIQYETEWERITGSAIELEIAKLEEKVRDDITLQAEILTAGKESLETETNELLLQFEKHFLEKRFQELLIELKKAERDKDTVRSLELLGECQQISKKIHDIKSKQV